MRAVLLTTLLASLICSSVPHRTLSASPPRSVLLQLQAAASASLLRRRAFHALSALGVPPSQGKCFRWGTKSLRVLGGVTSCVCRAGYVGANCHLAVAALAVHPHGRYVGPVRCERGAIVDGQCQCDAGWEGYHCALPTCPGTWRCPPGAKARLCAKAVCVCADRAQVASNPTCFGYSPPPPPAPNTTTTTTTTPLPTPDEMGPVGAAIVKEFLGKMKAKRRNPALREAGGGAGGGEGKHLKGAGEAPGGCDVKDCVGGTGEVTGKFDPVGCACVCNAGWAGEFCEREEGGGKGVSSPVALTEDLGDIAPVPNATEVEATKDKKTRAAKKEKATAAHAAAEAEMAKGGATALDAIEPVDPSDVPEPAGPAAPAAGQTIIAGGQDGDGSGGADDAPVDIDPDLLKR